MEDNTNSIKMFKDISEVLLYLQEDSGRQIGKSKLYEDITKGLLRKCNKKFRKIDVDKYAASLPKSSTSNRRVAGVEDRQRRKEEAEIRIKEAQAEREEKRNAIMEGKYVLREAVDQELAAKAIALNTGLKTKIEASALELVNKVGGVPKLALTLVQAMEVLVDSVCNMYAQPIEFEVSLDGEGKEVGNNTTNID